MSYLLKENSEIKKKKHKKMEATHNKEKKSDPIGF